MKNYDEITQALEVEIATTDPIDAIRKADLLQLLKDTLEFVEFQNEVNHELESKNEDLQDKIRRARSELED